VNLALRWRDVRQPLPRRMTWYSRSVAAPEDPQRLDARAALVRDRLKQVTDPVALLESIFAYAPVALQIYNTAGHSILTNRAFTDLFGSEPRPNTTCSRTRSRNAAACSD